MPGTIDMPTPPGLGYDPGRRNCKGLRLSIPQTMIPHEDEELSVSPEPTSSRTLSLRKSRLYTVPEHSLEEEEVATPKTADSLNTRVDTLEINFSVLTKRVEGLKRMLDGVRGDLCGLGGTLDGMERSFSGKKIIARSDI